MKVLCISDYNINEAVITQVIGKIYTVFRFISKGQLGAQCDCYVLSELMFSPKDGNICAYNCECFVPISEIDETEMIREYNTEKTLL